MDEFKIKFRGVRGSYPVAHKDFLKYGGNTACIEIHVGGHLIILDAGTGLISLGNELMQKYIEASLFFYSAGGLDQCSYFPFTQGCLQFLLIDQV